jgi:TP901-1 family phage major tail protein
MSKYGGKDLLIKRKITATAWAATTAYLAGAYVTNGLNTYRCKTAGTSAGSGGPTGTTAGITDGTVVWDFVGVTSTTSHVTVAGMRSTGLTINNEQVDVTDKGDVPWRQLLAVGIRSMELSASGIFSNAAVLSDIMNDVTNGSIVTFKAISGRGDYFDGDFLVSSCERNGEYNGAEQYSLSLSSAGAVVYTPAP